MRSPRAHQRRWCAVALVVLAACAEPSDPGLRSGPIVRPALTIFEVPERPPPSGPVGPLPTLPTLATAPPPPPTSSAPVTEPPPTEPATTLPQVACTPMAPPPELGLDPFYTQYCGVLGLPIIASAVVDPAALQTAAAEILAMAGGDEAAVAAIGATGVRFGIVGKDQRTTEMPEYIGLDETNPIDGGWDARARGLGATAVRPLVSAGEENIICLDDPRYSGESILIHEFAHTFLDFGLNVTRPGFKDQVVAAYVVAQTNGTWAGTYAATNADEYWAEAVQSYFDANLEGLATGSDHGFIDTREELATADPTLFALIDDAYKSSPWRWPGCG